MKKTKKIVSFIALTSIPLISTIGTISCSSNTTNNNDNSQPIKPTNDFSQLIKNLIKEKKLMIKLNNQEQPDISRNYFEKYKNNISIISKLLKFENNSDLELNWKLANSLQYDENAKKIVYEIEIYSKTESTTVKGEISYNFVSDQTYYSSIIQEFETKISFKQEFINSKIIHLFEQTKTNQEFIERFIDKTYFNDFYIGINIRLRIPTQTINNLASVNSYSNLKFNLDLYDAQTNEKINIQQNNLIYLKLNKENVSPLTILEQDDLLLSSFNENYYGQLFIRPNSHLVNEKVVININFQNKNIVGNLDLTAFLNLEFGPICDFSSNNITNIKFNQDATIIFQNKSTKPIFSQNLFQEVYLPKKVINYHSTIFGNANIYGIESIISSWKDLIDNSTSIEPNLHLEKLQNSNDVNEVLKIIESVQKKKSNFTFNKVFLPKVSFNSNSKIICNEIVFYDYQQQNQVGDFVSSISNWTIKKEILIPPYIVKISKNLLPKGIGIKREFNPTINNLVSNNSLDLSQTINFTNVSNLGINGKLMDKILNLNDYFYSFDNDDTKKLNINKIIFKNPNISNFNTYSWDFFNNQKQKEILFTSTVKSIDSSSFTSLRLNKTIKITRENSLSDSVFSNGTLKLNELYNENPNEKNWNNLLIGLESIINTIDLSGLDEIKANTFYMLKGFKSSLVLDLTNIKNIRTNAFRDTDIQLNTSNFFPEIIEDYAFYYSSLQGDLDLSQLSGKEIAMYSFSNTKITSVILPSNISIIKSSAFYSCNKLTTINLENIEDIGGSAFNGTKINSITLSPQIKNIGYGAFKNSPLEVVQNINLNMFNKNKIEDIFDKGNIAKIFQNSSINEIYANINYNPTTKILDLSQKKLQDYDLYNNLQFLFNNSSVSSTFATETNPINELILPLSETTLSSNINIFNGKYINKITWNATNKNFGSTRLSGIKIQTLSDNFFKGAGIVPNNFASGLNLEMNEINLETVYEIGNNAFSGNRIKKFINTKNVISIGSAAFDSNVEFEIGQNVKLKDDSFSKIGIIGNNNSKITRLKVFSDNSDFNMIYDQKSKILDYTKAQKSNLIAQPWINTWLDKFKNISEYLLEGDVEDLILPNVYIISNNLYNNLGNVKKIKFQNQNQQILYGSFSGTNVDIKPKLSQTNIILDQDNFLAK